MHLFSWASRGNYSLEYLLTVNLRQPVPRDIFESRNACPEGYYHAPLQLAQRDRIDEAWTSYADDDVEVYCRHQMETTVQAPSRSTVEQRHGSVSGHPHGKIVDTEQHRSGWCQALDSQVKL
ncbi:AP-3 adaptor complex subunit beta [Aspergillus luchuensis]|uniref:AP-3 adaptor complex subunit beta n=1 Tax=Aspergillus kawachii TaxID=1069201 RepID=A0A146FSV6_ASPKA|nr:AP-3 adaptor complex subunit beta [Aspergillus luchuensis]